ncbi:MAG: outer membrane protein assembly factor BamD [Chitinispirillia bacterium]|jgi:outer membrane protein assembly factor BamD
MNNKVLFISLITAVIAGSYTDLSAKVRKLFNCTKKIERAKEYYKKEQFYRAKTTLSEVKVNCSGHSSMDTVLYILIKSNLETKNAVEARLDLEVFIQDFPNSPFVEEAHFLLGYCSYRESESYERDQVKTREAINEFQEFIVNFPNSPYKDSAQHYINLSREKLAKKEVMNARFYEKIDQFDAAIIYYKLIIENFPDSKNITEYRFALYRNLMKTSRPGEAKTVLERIISSETDKESKRKAENLLNKLNLSNEENLETTPGNTEKKSKP